MARLHTNPLIPAKAGIQVIERRAHRPSLGACPAGAPSYDLDPGLRRDERNGGTR